MPIESEILNFALNNGIGAVFGVLMWLQANTAIKENTKSNLELREAVLKLTENLNGKRPN